MILIVVSRWGQHDVLVKTRVPILCRLLQFDLCSVQSNRSVRRAFGIVSSLYEICSFGVTSVSFVAVVIDDNVLVVTIADLRAWESVVAVRGVNSGRVLRRVIVVRCACVWRSNGDVARVIFYLSWLISATDGRIAVCKKDFRILHGHILIGRGGAPRGLFAGIEREMRLVFRRALRAVERRSVTKSFVTRERSVCYNPANIYVCFFFFCLMELNAGVWCERENWISKFKIISWDI